MTDSRLACDIRPVKNLPPPPDDSIRRALRRGPAYHWVIPVALLVLPSILWFASRRAYWWLSDEDHLVEWLTCFGYVGCVVLAAIVAVRLHRKRLRLEAGLYVLLVLGFIFVAGEEVSWGQRILDFDGPAALVESNTQNEANLHNLLGRRSLEGVYILVGLFGAMGARWLVPRLPALRQRSWLFAPPALLAPWFLAVAVYYTWVDYIDVVTVGLLGDAVEWRQVKRLQEYPELALACGFLLFTTYVFQRTRSGALDAAADDEGTALAPSRTTRPDPDPSLG